MWDEFRDSVILIPTIMATSAIDEAVRNAVAVGADPSRIAILDNFCWGNTDRPETLGTLVRAALGCHDLAIAWKTPFISGKDSLNNEFAWLYSAGRKQTIAIPSSLLISAIGQVDDVRQCVTMDLKSSEMSFIAWVLPATNWEVPMQLWFSDWTAVMSIKSTRHGASIVHGAPSRHAVRMDPGLSRYERRRVSGKRLPR